MARSVTAAAMLLRVRDATDSNNDTHLTDAEIYRYLTAAVAKTWDVVLTHGLGGEFVKSATFSTVANQQPYALATIVSDGDFYQVKTLYAVESDGQLRPIPRVNPAETHGMRAPLGVYSMKLYYVPCAPVFTTGSESFDGINGWEEHTIQLAAIAVKKKKQDDVSQYKASLREIEEVMKVQANRNADSPPRVVRRARARHLANCTIPYSSNVTHWDIRGSNLELYYNYGIYL